MKKIFLILALLAMPLTSVGAASDYYIKLGDIDGEAVAGIEPDEIDSRFNDDDDTEASVSGYIKLDDIKGESTENRGVEPDEIDDKFDDDDDDSMKGGTEDINIGIGELENEGIEPDEIDSRFNDDDEQESNFAILLSSGSGDDEDGDDGGEGKKEQVEDILLNALRESDVVPVDSISLNFDKIETKVEQTVKFLGFIPVKVKAVIEIDESEEVKVKFPWWTFLAKKEIDPEELGGKVFNALSDIMKSQHDTLKSIINNIR